MTTTTETYFLSKTDAGRNAPADMLDTEHVWLACPKCGGTGRISSYSHIESGRCFKCDGDGNRRTAVLGECRKLARAADAREAKRREKFEAEGRRLREAHAAWVAANQADWDLICRYSHVSQLALELAGTHSLPTEGQLAAIHKMAERDAATEARKAAGVTVPEGRYPIEGSVVSVRNVIPVRIDGNNFSYSGGEVAKAIVEHADGWRVWVTVPNAVELPVRGDRVEFTATVTRSNRDQLFGFAKRPVKWVNHGEAERAAAAQAALEASLTGQDYRTIAEGGQLLVSGPNAKALGHPEPTEREVREAWTKDVILAEYLHPHGMAHLLTAETAAAIRDAMRMNR